MSENLQSSSIEVPSYAQAPNICPKKHNLYLQSCHISPEHSRLRVPVLRLWCYAPDFDKAKARVHKSIDRLRMLVETRC